VFFNGYAFLAREHMKSPLHLASSSAPASGLAAADDCFGLHVF
jgi:hypothetical protein